MGESSPLLLYVGRCNLWRLVDDMIFIIERNEGELARMTTFSSLIQQIIESSEYEVDSITNTVNKITISATIGAPIPSPSGNCRLCGQEIQR